MVNSIICNCPAGALPLGSIFCFPCNGLSGKESWSAQKQESFCANVGNRLLSCSASVVADDAPASSGFESFCCVLQIFAESPTKYKTFCFSGLLNTFSGLEICLDKTTWYRKMSARGRGRGGRAGRGGFVVQGKVKPEVAKAPIVTDCVTLERWART